MCFTQLGVAQLAIIYSLVKYLINIFIILKKELINTKFEDQKSERKLKKYNELIICSDWKQNKNFSKANKKKKF
jgi:hypothetical protein